MHTCWRKIPPRRWVSSLIFFVSLHYKNQWEDARAYVSCLKLVSWLTCSIIWKIGRKHKDRSVTTALRNYRNDSWTIISPTSRVCTASKSSAWLCMNNNSLCHPKNMNIHKWCTEQTLPKKASVPISNCLDWHKYCCSRTGCTSMWHSIGLFLAFLPDVKQCSV